MICWATKWHKDTKHPSAWRTINAYQGYQRSIIAQISATKVDWKWQLVGVKILIFIFHSGISVNCSDIYLYNLDCQWVDISEIDTGSYILKIAVNPEFKVAEMSFDNNAAVCNLLYTDTYARVDGCRLSRP